MNVNGIVESSVLLKKTLDPKQVTSMRILQPMPDVFSGPGRSNSISIDARFEENVGKIIDKVA